MMTARILYLAVVAALLCACGSDPSEPPELQQPPSLTHTQVAHLAAMVGNFVTAEGFPNLAIGVVKEGELVWQAGFGIGARPGTPPNKETLFGIGSVTKVVTATALLSLVEDGVLSLEDEAATWLPEARGLLSPEGKTPIRLRHLLNHSSGLPRDSSLRTSRDVTITNEALLAALAGDTLLYTPGTNHSYSNLGMSLVGVVISRASGQPYESFVKERVLAPLGMNASVFDTPASGAAPGHYPYPFGGYTPSGEMWRLGAINPAGGLYSSVQDLVGLVRHGLGRASVLS
jgi:CubicO group peptidase (beta-lactamase class C family)